MWCLKSLSFQNLVIQATDIMDEINVQYKESLVSKLLCDQVHFRSASDSLYWYKEQLAKHGEAL